jgi:XTP/dITP diphosphohydrolase
LEAAQGEHGFGYDPLFFIPQLQKTAAELSAEEKNQISHRGQALNLLLQELNKKLNKKIGLSG